ncbi:MAG TPA: hypothetical protein VLT62_24520 [Candidatus Methylomirabilis sp.]|nr:hypothetical protein [Candidatus Methylomirabilis sp.]
MKNLVGIIGVAVLAVSLAGGAIWSHRSIADPVLTASVSEKKDSHIDPDAGKTRDSCVPPHPFDLPTQRPTAC